MPCDCENWPGIKQTGQVLLEVMTSMVLLAFLSISILGVHLQASQWISQARSLNQASCLSYSLIDCLRGGDPYNDWSQIVGAGWVDAGDLGLEFLVPGDMNAYLNIEKTPVSDYLYEVGARVEWSEGNAIRRLDLYTRMRPKEV